MFAISIPQFVPGGGFDPAALRAHLARAEALGFDGAWTMEQVQGTWANLGPIELMAYAAACTERLRLGCAVLVSPLHNPVHLAKSLATLDHLSGGRLEVGIGTGGRGRMFSAFEVDPASLVARFTEGLRLMKALWTEPRVSSEGRFWRLQDAAMEPKPLQRPHPPVWFGGSHPAALRRAVRLGDGFFGAGSTTTARFAEQVAIVREALAETGRDPAEEVGAAGSAWRSAEGGSPPLRTGFRIAKRIYICVDDDAGRARRRVADGLHRLYSYFGLNGLEPVAVAGPPEACADGVREVAKAGAELILFTPLDDETEQMERLAGEVVPLLS